MIYDGGSSFLIGTSDNDGATWSYTSFPTAGTNKADQVDIIRTPVPGLLFAFAHDAGVPDLVVRSTDNGETWQQVGAPPSGVNAPNAFAYDAESDHLYSAWGWGMVRALPAASTRPWGVVAGGDWAILPALGDAAGDRGLALDGNGALGLLGP